MKLDGELNIFFKVELCFTIERVQTRSDVVKQAQVAQTKMMCRRVQLGLYLFFSYKKTKNHILASRALLYNKHMSSADSYWDLVISALQSKCLITTVFMTNKIVVLL